jgi:hypothetical protein
MEHGGVWAARPHSTPVPSAPVITPCTGGPAWEAITVQATAHRLPTRRTLLTGWRTWLLLRVTCLFEALEAA